MNNSENPGSGSENIPNLTQEQQAFDSSGQPSSENESGATPLSASALSATPTYADPKSYPEAPFSYRFSERENVSLGTGALEYRERDFTLPGKNSFDLAIARVYSSSESGLYEMASESYGSGQLRTTRRDNTHNLLQYGLGLGWRFELPSIETVAQRLRAEDTSYSDFLHLDDGRNLEIGETNGILGFKDYPLQDVTIEASIGTLTHPCRAGLTASYDVIVSYKNGHKDYFGKVTDGDGRLDHYTLTARMDRFGDCQFFTLHPYGGMEAVDSFGRDVTLARTGEVLTWTLPADGDNNPLTLSYETENNGKKLVRSVDLMGRETQYGYYDPDSYSAVCKYASAQYGDTTDTSFPFLLLGEIDHPTGAKTVFS